MSTEKDDFKKERKLWRRFVAYLPTMCPKKKQTMHYQARLEFVPSYRTEFQSAHPFIERVKSLVAQYYEHVRTDRSAGSHAHATAKMSESLETHPNSVVFKHHAKIAELSTRIIDAAAQGETEITVDYWKFVRY